LEDDVEIGSCSTVDRAVFGTTIIKKGTKVDNLVQIAHNCELGEGCIIVSQTGISGSTTLGRNVIMGGQSATSGHLSIGDFATIAARGGVSKSLPGGKIYGGFPILLQKDWLKLQAKISRFFTK
jgi:UDP-3-O-[3-hydroxymyristoyl] glucosamine N-acyltransferase